MDGKWKDGTFSNIMQYNNIVKTNQNTLDIVIIMYTNKTTKLKNKGSKTRSFLKAQLNAVYKRFA